MNERSFNNTIYLLVGGITVFILSILMWDYFHGGVPSHHLLANENLPEISNWWGVITLPLFSYFLLMRMKKRLNNEDQNKNLFLLPFFFSLLYAITLAVSFSTGNTKISSLLFQSIPLIALFFPIYLSEYLLGFIIGLVYTFGGVLPIIIGGVIAIISYIIYNYLRSFILFISTKIGIIKR
ncbi:MAG TPA: hypothetical protein PLY70_07780 [Saprospiraceae bacterium]|nr:hypothetical protein [Saprospiraceae bacterium]HPN69804.1 hypothetical protein [Saprospiraceae bacterium]